MQENKNIQVNRNRLLAHMASSLLAQMVIVMMIQDNHENTEHVRSESQNWEEVSHLEINDR